MNIAIVLEGDILNGNAEIWTALYNEMLESNMGAPGLLLRRSKFGRRRNDDVEPCTEIDNSERGGDEHHATAARDNCQRTDNSRTIGGVQHYALNGTRRSTAR